MVRPVRGLDLGTFTYGDRTVQEIPIVNENGEAFDFTGATAITLVCRTTEQASAEITLTAPDPHDGILSFADPALVFEPTRARPLIHVTGRVRWTFQSKEYWAADAVKFAIELFP